MAANPRFKPAPNQIVSDLGQLQLFTNPMKMRILRILQQQESTIPTLASAVGESEEVVERHVRELFDRRIVTIVEQESRALSPTVYRATALIYNFRPDPADVVTPATSFAGATVAAATLDSVTSEVLASLTNWPDQRLGYEGRRRRMPYARAVEFHEKLADLVDQYWARRESLTMTIRTIPSWRLSGFGTASRTANRDADLPVLYAAGDSRYYVMERSVRGPRSEGAWRTYVRR
jgi:DNA-binding transcriptional ArsR family regulator